MPMREIRDFLKEKRLFSGQRERKRNNERHIRSGEKGSSAAKEQKETPVRLEGRENVQLSWSERARGGMAGSTARPKMIPSRRWRLKKRKRNQSTLWKRKKGDAGGTYLRDTQSKGSEQYSPEQGSREKSARKKEGDPICLPFKGEKKRKVADSFLRGGGKGGRMWRARDLHKRGI